MSLFPVYPSLHVAISSLPFTTCRYFQFTLHYMSLFPVYPSLHVAISSLPFTTCRYFQFTLHYMLLFPVCPSLHVAISSLPFTTCRYFQFTLHYMSLCPPYVHVVGTKHNMQRISLRECCTWAVRRSGVPSAIFHLPNVCLFLSSSPTRVHGN